mmetsp:Transcript_80890/g.187836  ORF Transcript_80890/g.187836 Transcript_80890/m.187836 type:complete len:240 (+) Transcript_80890:125-844(+)
MKKPSLRQVQHLHPFAHKMVKITAQRLMLLAKEPVHLEFRVLERLNFLCQKPAILQELVKNVNLETTLDLRKERPLVFPPHRGADSGPRRFAVFVVGLTEAAATATGVKRLAVLVGALSSRPATAVYASAFPHHLGVYEAAELVVGAAHHATPATAVESLATASEAGGCSSATTRLARHDAHQLRPLFLHNSTCRWLHVYVGGHLVYNRRFLLRCRQGWCLRRFWRLFRFSWGRSLSRL